MKEPAGPVPGAAASQWMNRLAAHAAIAACVIVFYWVPMTSPSASIHGDAADLHYPMQKYLSDRFFAPPISVLDSLPALRLPACGQSGGGRVVPAQLAFPSDRHHSALHPTGVGSERIAGLPGRLSADLKPRREPHSGDSGAFAYGLSGFFAGHASQVSLFAAAAMFPWLLVAYRRAIDVGPVRYMAFGGLVGAALILAGSGQAAVYSFLGLGLYAFADWWRERQGCLDKVVAIGFMLAGALACAAIQLLPARELAGESSRAADSSTIAGGFLHPGSLMTLVAPNWLGAISGGIQGPSGAAQFLLLRRPVGSAAGTHRRGQERSAAGGVVPHRAACVVHARTRRRSVLPGKAGARPAQIPCAGRGLVPGRTRSGVAGGGG